MPGCVGEGAFRSGLTLNYYIWDATDVTRIDLNDYEIAIPAAIAVASSSYKPLLKGAFVASSKEVQDTIRRYFDKSIELGSPWNLKLFDNIKDAREWAVLK